SRAPPCRRGAGRGGPRPTSSRRSPRWTRPGARRWSPGASRTARCAGTSRCRGKGRPCSSPMTRGRTREGTASVRDVGLLFPGASGDDPVDDVAVLRALLRTEVAWVRAQATAGLVPGPVADEVAAAAAGLGTDAGPLTERVAAEAAAGGHPVLPLLAGLRAAAPEHAAVVHAGLTSRGGPDTAHGLRTAAAPLPCRVAAEAAAGATPVIPLLAALRAAARERAAVVHAGLTSQDVLDTALVLVLRDAAASATADLGRACAAAARL